MLRPKRGAYRTAAIVGLALAAIGTVVVGTVASTLVRTPTTSPNFASTLAVTVGAIVFMGSLAFVGWFTSLPPVLTVTRTRLTLIGGAHRRREDRSHIVGVYRGGAPARTGLDRSYFVVLTTVRAITVPLRHFDPAGLEEAMRRLEVPMKGDFTQPTDEVTVKLLFGRQIA